MSCTCGSTTLPMCGCCAGTTQETPQAITNRAGLSSVSYRVGTWATFNASMLASLSSSAYPALAQLRTRDTSDFTIALLDGWATVLDILTFYQERFANEAFLGTAVDQRSVFELAKLVGYSPSPGVAASAVLAFTLSSAPGSPDNVPIPPGTRVQSVPGPGQTAQVFETSGDIVAQIGWNAIPAQTTTSWSLAAGATSTWISGTANNINVGDALLFVAAQGGVPSNTGPTDFHYITAVSPNSATGTTQVTWDGPLSSSSFSNEDASTMCIYTFDKKAALYGVQAPNLMTLAGTTLASTTLQYVKGYVGPPYGSGSTWDYASLYQDGSYTINLDASYPGLEPSQAPGAQPQWLVLTGTGEGYTSVFQITNAVDTNPNYFTLTAKTTQVTLQKVQILAGASWLNANELIYLFVAETPGITAYVQSRLLTPSPMPCTTPMPPGPCSFQPGMVVPVQGSVLAVVGAQQIAPGQAIGVSGQRVRLQVGLDQQDDCQFVPTGSSGSVAVQGGQVYLVTAFPPAADPTTTGNLVWQVQTLSGVAGQLSAPATAAAVQLMPASPKNPKDPVVSEAAIVQSVDVAGDVTTLTLVSPLNGIYDALSTNVNANAVMGSHGQTVQEILGSGDSSNDALQFTLKQGPLTYLPSPSGTGSQSSLQVWVNNMQWEEVPSLLACGNADRAFVTRAGPSGNRVITFGNGMQGARTPTGVSNIRAVYRAGTGTPGMVGAGQLSQPLDRPQGVQSVINPSAASGAADPAAASDARASAPLPTLMVNRVVSLEDYQNFALNFSGISKALATWTWSGDVRGVFLTIAGPNGTTLSADDPVVTSLIDAIQLASEPFVPVTVVSFRPVLFTFTAVVAVDQPTYDPNQVLAQVWQSVSTVFAFEQRQLGQGLAASEVVQVVQAVPGVVALQLQSLTSSGERQPQIRERMRRIPGPSGPPAVLPASGPVPPLGAQLLQIDPATQGTITRWYI